MGCKTSYDESKASSPSGSIANTSDSNNSVNSAHTITSNRDEIVKKYRYTEKRPRPLVNIRKIDNKQQIKINAGRKRWKSILKCYFLALSALVFYAETVIFVLLFHFSIFIIID